MREPIRALYLLRTELTDPYHNLALEAVLLRRVQPGECILYLWRNQRTVVIGRNQNAENECRIQALEQEGGHLARRLSGGGAVYHDLGNLNFTFLTPSASYDVAQQTAVILRAVQQVGIRAEKTGRNDLTVDGRKFSGHAYYHTAGKSYHHGTLMVDVDKAPLERYLNVSTLKLRAKGVPSVRSRVANLVEFAPALTTASLSDALTDAFGAVYGLPVQPLEESSLDAAEIAAEQERFASPAWKYGRTRPLAHSREARFAWGTVRLDFSEADGAVTDAALWSDGLDADFLEQVPVLLRGCPLEAETVRARLSAAPDAPDAIVTDLVSILCSKRGVTDAL